MKLFKSSNLPAERSNRVRSSLTVVDTMDNFADAVGEFSEAARNYAESVRISSQRSLIRSHEKLKDTIENSSLSDSMLREILGSDYYRYRD
jgi:hypothetical protein